MRKTLVALSAFALAVTLGACGGNEGGNGASTNGDATPSGGGGSVVAKNVAELAKSIGDKTSDTNTAHMKFTGDAGGQEITGEGDVQFGSAKPAMKMDMTTAEGNMSMVLLEEALYIKLPQELEPGKPWLKIDATTNSELATALAGMSEQMSENTDPRATLEQFEKAGTITDTKEETLDGKKTTHYSITVDVQKLADSQTDETMKQAMQQAITQGLKDFPVEVWIDEDDLPVRLKMEMPTPDPSTGQTMQVGVQVDYSKWGEPVDIAAPPAEQIAEMPA